MKITIRDLFIIGMFVMSAGGAAAQSSSGVNINWGLLKTPDHAGDYARAYQQGQRVEAGRGSGEMASAEPFKAPRSRFTLHRSGGAGRHERQRRGAS